MVSALALASAAGFTVAAFGGGAGPIFSVPSRRERLRPRSARKQNTSAAQSVANPKARHTIGPLASEANRSLVRALECLASTTALESFGMLGM
jgi:hypothetical protein